MHNETYSLLNNKRTVFLNEDFTHSTATDLSALLLYFDNINHSEPINLYINSYGGDVASLCHIYDVMNIVTCPIKTICVGRCSSAASVILASGAKNQRFAFKNSRIMIHGIQCSYPILGDDVKNSKLYLDSLEAYNDIVINILSENTGKSFEQVKKDCSEDVWMTPEQAKEYGIIDKIL